MEPLSDKSNSLNFFNHMLNFDEDNKAQLMNILQYAILAIIPVVLVLKLVKYIVPEEDESKSTLEIVLECVGQLILIILALWFSNKAIRYVPTYSKYEYPSSDLVNYILPFLLILTTMQTKFGSKINILFDRFVVMINGSKEGQSDKKQTNDKVNVTKPIANMQQQQQQQPQMDLSVLPPAGQIPQMASSNNSGQTPDFINMYQQQTTGMPGAAMPGDNGIMAANESMGSPFSNW